MINLSFYFRNVPDNVTAERVTDRRFGGILVTVTHITGDFSAYVDDIHEIPDVLKTQGITGLYPIFDPSTTDDE